MSDEEHVRRAERVRNKREREAKRDNGKMVVREQAGMIWETEEI